MSNVDSSEKSEHLRSLRRKGFQPEVDEHLFTSEELEILRNYGNWLKDLEEGTISPITEEQRQLLLAVKFGSNYTGSEIGKTRIKYRRLMWEKKKRIADGHPGMGEWERQRQKIEREWNQLDTRLGSPSTGKRTCPVCGGDGGAGGRSCSYCYAGWV